MRICERRLDPVAAKAADDAVARSAEALASGLKPFRISMNRSSAPLRKLWIDAYVQNGGKCQTVGGVRLAIPLTVSSGAAAAAADTVFRTQCPELSGRRLTLDDRDASLRVKWMDLYVEFGGKVAFLN